MIFYHHDFDTGVRTGYRIERNVSAQVILIAPFVIGEDGSKSYFVSETFIFNPAAIRADERLARHWDIHSCWALEAPDGSHTLGRLHPAWPSHDLRRDLPVFFYVPYRESSIEEISVLCCIHPGAEVETAEKAEKVEDRLRLEHRILPRLAIDVPSDCPADETVEGEVRLIDPGADEIIDRQATVFLQSDSGYLNRTSLKLSKGRASFLFKPWLLRAGDVCTIRAGFGHFPDKATAELRVK